MKRARSAEKLRELATELLAKCNIHNAPVPIGRVAEHLGASIRYSPFEGELAGMLVRGDDEDTIIGVNSLHHPNRQRFTIAHECGHLMLHRGKSIHIDRTFRVNRRDAVSSQATDPNEIEANRFAAELLMPYELLLSDIVDSMIDVEDDQELKRLASRYEVSVQALTHRITHIFKSVF